MEAFDKFWSSAVELAWGIPLVVLLIGAGAFLFVYSRFIPFRALKHTVKILRGKYDDKNDPGEISHFQALTSALSATIGMGNIAGVALAISAGGPGAIFWMWVAGLVGMATKFFTCTLATMYRKKDEKGIEQGGPMYFIEVGLGKKFKPLAMMFAMFGMIGCLALYQSNQMARLLDVEWGVSPWISGVLAMGIVGIVILGGIKRVGKVTSKLVPPMFLLYVIASLVVISMNWSMIPGVFVSIFSSAFGGDAIVGGVAGVALREVIVTGVRRAAFSNEAGIGTAAMAHGAAKTKEPIREGLVAMMGPFLDTHVVCTMTALVVLSTGVSVDANDVVLTVNAFESALPGLGLLIMTPIVVLFAVSTMISYSYYSIKCSKYLFGEKFGGLYIYIYILTIALAAVESSDTIVNIIDTAFAMMAIPNLFGALALSPKVVVALKDYFKRMNL